MSPDNPLYWKNFYRMESNHDLEKKLATTESAYERDKVENELKRRKEAGEVA